LGLGEDQVPICSLAEAEVGLQQAPHPALLFWQDIRKARCCPTQRWSSCLGWLYQMPKTVRLGRTETGNAIRKIRALSTVRDGFGWSVPGRSTQPSPTGEPLRKGGGSTAADPRRRPGWVTGREEKQPSTRWEGLENKEDLPWVSCWRQSPAPLLQKIKV